MTKRTPTQLPAAFETSREAFLASLIGKNRSEATLRAYSTDIGQLVQFLTENNVCVQGPADVTRDDVTEYLTQLGKRGLSGVTMT